MFVKLTRKSDGKTIYVNPAHVSGITPDERSVYVWSCDNTNQPFEVEESIDMVVMFLEDALNGGNK